MLEDISSVLGHVPSNANRVVLRCRASAQNAKARLHRFEGDEAPQTIYGREGTIRISLSTSRQLLLERCDQSEWVVRCVSHQLAWHDRIRACIVNVWKDRVSGAGLGLPALAFLVGIAVPSLYWKFVSGPKGDFLTFIYNVAPMLAVLLSVGTLVVSLRHNRFSMGVEILARLQREFDGESMRIIRARASKSLLHPSTRENRDVDDILDFFENVALLEKRGAIDIELVWHAFYYWFTVYFDMTRAYRIEARTEDSTQWEDIERLYVRIQAEQMRRAEKAPFSLASETDIQGVSEAQRSFLYTEISEAPVSGHRKVRRPCESR